MSDASVGSRTAIIMSICRADDCVEQTHDDDDRFAPPSSAQVNTPSGRAINRHPSVSLTTAAPARRAFFDPWNSSSTGHQRAENRRSSSTSWRVSRSLKLAEQYKGGLAGGVRVAYAVGAGREDSGKESRNEDSGWEKGARGVRTSSQQSLTEIWGARKAGKKCVLKEETLHTEHSTLPDHAVQPAKCTVNIEPDLGNENLKSTSVTKPKQIFDGLCFYVNGSTAPLVSDHKLKQLLAVHGARHSITLGRRTVTHVISGVINANRGAGGGLAAAKTQKEIVRSSGKAIKYITAEWVLESIKAGRRLPESRFAPFKLAPKNQGSVFGM